MAFVLAGVLALLAAGLGVPGQLAVDAVELSLLAVLLVGVADGLGQYQQSEAVALHDVDEAIHALVLALVLVTADTGHALQRRVAQPVAPVAGEFRDDGVRLRRGHVDAADVAAPEIAAQVGEEAVVGEVDEILWGVVALVGEVAGESDVEADALSLASQEIDQVDAGDGHAGEDVLHGLGARGLVLVGDLVDAEELEIGLEAGDALEGAAGRGDAVAGLQPVGAPQRQVIGCLAHGLTAVRYR